VAKWGRHAGSGEAVGRRIVRVAHGPQQVSAPSHSLFAPSDDSFRLAFSAVLRIAAGFLSGRHFLLLSTLEASLDGPSATRLFSWIKKPPSAAGLLYAIDEAQTFLPSQKPMAGEDHGPVPFTHELAAGLGADERPFLP
jgi:hypothetical protein